VVAIVSTWPMTEQLSLNLAAKGGILGSVRMMCIVWHLRFTRWRTYNLWFSGLLRRVVWWLDTNVSEGRADSIFRMFGKPWIICTLFIKCLSSQAYCRALQLDRIICQLSTMWNMNPTFVTHARDFSQTFFDRTLTFVC